MGKNQTGMEIGFKENTMKDLTKKGVMAACSLAFFGFAAGQAQALTIDIYQVGTEDAAINAWLGSNYTIIEDFEELNTGWYQSLSTDVGEFAAIGLPGTGSTSYANKVGGEGAYFELRDYDDNGRRNFTAGGSNYLDSADITGLSLNVNEGEFNNLFFYLSDPSDVGAVTTTMGATLNSGAWRNLSGLSDGNEWFVGIKADDGDTIINIKWLTSNTNDGFGIDDFGTTATSAVPEPTTALLLSAGLLPLVGLRRRKKK